MTTNIGSWDRILRAVAGIALILWAAAFAGPLWAYIGIVPLVTALIGWCPAYMPFGINTCASRKG